MQDFVKTPIDPTTKRWRRIAFYPTRVTTKIPQHLPPAVQTVLLEAEAARSAGLIHASGLAFGKALDLAIKTMSNGEGHSLADRIRILGTSGRISAELAEWAQGLRVIRNEATHEDEPLAKEDIEDVAAATSLILQYLYTLPGKLASLKRDPKTGVAP